MIWSQKRKNEATVRDVIQYFERLAENRAVFDRYYRGMDGYEFNYQPPSDFFSDELIEQGRKEIIKRKLEDLHSYVIELEEYTIPKTKREIIRLEKKLEEGL
jgi:hypothetical protein